MATVKYFQTNDTNEKNSISWRNVIFSVITAFFLLILGMFVISFLVVYGPLSSEFAETFVNSLYYVSCLICGFISSISNRRKGWFYGLLAGVLYFGTVVASSVSVAKTSVDISALLRFLITVILSMAGGIVGVNTKKGKRK